MLTEITIFIIQLTLQKISQIVGKIIQRERKLFFSWLSKAKTDIIEDPLNFIEGLDSLKTRLAKGFGSEVIEKSFESYGKEIYNKKNEGKLSLTTDGYVSTSDNTIGKQIPKHSFYGGE